MNGDIKPAPVTSSYLKPIVPLDDTQAAQMSDLVQQEAGIGQIMADAQTDWSNAMQAYQVALDQFNADNFPNAARDNYNNIMAKCQMETARIIEAKRAIRTLELADDSAPVIDA